MMTHNEIASVVQASKEGKPIQYRFVATEGPWQDDDRTEPHRPDFNFFSYDYRIKPEPPKAREFMIAWCDKHGSTLKAWDARYEAPHRECEACHTVFVREVLPES